MLAYVYKPLNKDDYKKISAEEFNNVLDLLSRIITLGVNRLIKQGFFRDYIRKTETSSSIRGKINITESIKTLSCMKKQLNFTYNEYSINNYLNQIIKTTLLLFIKSTEVRRETKNDIKRILFYLSDVDTLDAKSINWNINYYRNNQEYEMIINFCHLAINGLLQTEKEGELKLLHFTEKLMYDLYEKFIYNYYKKECNKYLTVDRKNIKWPLNNQDANKDNLLPNMEPDIVLSSKTKRKVLIIDAKYYPKIYNDNGNFRSEHLYQILTYVKSKDFEFNDKIDNKNEYYEVSGLLLYAGTEENIKPHQYMMDRNKISISMLDLNQDFKFISDDLNRIVKDFKC